jgi:phosphatidylglycerophosphatase A
MSRLARLVATLGPVGSAPLAPATAASGLVALAGWFLPVPPLWVALLAIAAGAGVSVWSAGEAEKVLGHDARPIVIDEVVGQSLALVLLPHSVRAFLAAFLLFRLFDIWKPFGAHEAQDLPGGWGITADDVIAGIAACAVFHAGTALLGAAGFRPW